jgi:sulfur carrier protein
MRIIINGETRQFDRSLNYAQLLNEMGWGGKRVAIERNGEIVPRSQFDTEVLRDGDQLEVVVAVGGG